MVSGYSCYDSKHKIIMGILMLLTRDPQMSKSIYVVDRIAKFLLNLIADVIAWLWNDQFGLQYQVMTDCLAI